ncbi:MAG TPA: anti-sigma factor [Citricoccus sp.]
MAETAERHLTEDDLVTIAAGQDPAPEASAHLRACASCRRHLEATDRVLAALAEPVELHVPPAGVWDAIARGTVDATPDQTPDRIPDQTSDLASDRPAPATAAFPARPRRRWPVVAAAAAGLVIGAVGAAVVTGVLVSRQEAGPSEAPVAVGEAVLAPVADDRLEGRAEMLSAPDGSLRLTVDVSGLPREGYYEVWLRDENASRLMSLGTVAGRTTTLPVPEGVDLERFPVVDVSQEHFDGDPSHSGVTLAAGAMTRTGGSGS